MARPVRARTATLLSAGAVLALVCALGVSSGSLGAHRHHKPTRTHVLTKPTWLAGVRLTEYFPVPERWFRGRRVAAPGLPGDHRIDWLYSARGVSMEGDGLGLDGRPVHIDALGSGGWINERGQPTVPDRRAHWSRGAPFWRAGAYWMTHERLPTFPLESGDWASGPGLRYVPLRGVSFAPGPSRPLRYYRSVAVDPRLIPLGSRIYIPAYRSSAGHGWFTAQDTGGAILGRHLDIYRPPPALASDSGRYLTRQRIYVVPPGHPARVPPGSPPQTSTAGPDGGTAPPESTTPPSSSGGAAPPS